MFFILFFYQEVPIEQNQTIIDKIFVKEKEDEIFAFELFDKSYLNIK